MSAAASRLASIKEMSEEELNRCESEEESIVYGQVKFIIIIFKYCFIARSDIKQIFVEVHSRFDI